MTNRADHDTADDLTLRDATPEDIGEILQLIRDLADYELAPTAAIATPELLHDALFGTDRVATAVLAEVNGADGTKRVIAGFALWFYNFSTWHGRRGLYLEDLFVRPAFRGRGIGGALLRHLASVAVEHGCARMEWSVLDWNVDAIGFYEHIGAEPLEGWTVYRMTGDALRKLAGMKGAIAEADPEAGTHTGGATP